MKVHVEPVKDAKDNSNLYVVTMEEHISTLVMLIVMVLTLLLWENVQLKKNLELVTVLKKFQEYVELMEQLIEIDETLNVLMLKLIIMENVTLLVTVT